MSPLERDYVLLMQRALDMPTGLDAHREGDAALVALVQELVNKGALPPTDWQAVVTMLPQALERYHAAVARDVKSVIYHVKAGPSVLETADSAEATRVSDAEWKLHTDELDAVKAELAATKGKLAACEAKLPPV